jgi:hypothetical protein
MRFSPLHLKELDAVNGAFSIVTEREVFDSQITLTGLEADIALSHFGEENILRGNVKTDPVKAEKTFHLYPSHNPIRLNLVFPKKRRSELRLYLKTDQFKPNPNDIWFIFTTKSQEICLGAMSETKWRQIGLLDNEDSDYQNDIYEQDIASTPPPTIKYGEKKSSIYVQRNPQIAVARFKLADFRCENVPEHETFISSKTEKPFVEAHHYVPLKFQNAFPKTPLDQLDNVFALCPNCHRAIHYAEINYRRELLQKLWEKRKAISGIYPLELENIFQLYNCEEYDFS